MSAPACSRNVSAGIRPDPGATSRLPAWWGADDWLYEVSLTVHADRDTCRAHHVAPDTVVAVARGLAAYADHRTGRDCRPTNVRLVEVVRVALSTVQRARRVLKDLGFVVELIRGRSIMTRMERLAAWRRGSSHRQIAAEFALCSRPRRAPKVSSSKVRDGDNSLGADLQSVDGDTPPGAKRVSSISHLGTTHLRRRTESRKPLRGAQTEGSDERPAGGGHDPATRGLAEAVQRRLRWLGGVSTRRTAPTLSRFARAGWTAKDVDRAVRDALAARGWQLPRTLTQPAAYLAALLRDVDPADRPGALDEHMAAVERAQRAYERQLFTGTPCEHGQPAGNVPSPLRGHLACPACRRAAAVVRP